MILCDNDGNTLAQAALLIKPDNWRIQEGAKAVHGITDEDCEKYGITSLAAYELFEQFVNIADVVVAHNITFDKSVMEMEARAHSKIATVMKSIHCTMKDKQVVDLCAVPAVGGRGGYKWPKLHVALATICGKKLRNAHSAMADAKACRDIYFEMRRRNVAI